MRLIQFETNDGGRAVGIVDGAQIRRVTGAESVRALALEAIEAGRGLGELVVSKGTAETLNYDELIAETRVLPPLDHEDPAHCLVAGTGLTHVASAAARSEMHKKSSPDAEEKLSDSMRMFNWGLEGGKPADGNPGVQPEWFFKGDGSIVSRPGEAYPVPDFAKDEGEEPEVVGLYVIGRDGLPYRVGFALGNEATDHVTEKMNYLYLAHSKLRFCSYGPELLLGDLPADVRGEVRIRRGGEVVWSKPFPTGEDNMSHSIANLEYHHFKYDQFLRPGDVHVQFMGTSVASFGDGFKTEDGDQFEVEAEGFGKPLINGTRRAPARVRFGGVKAL